MKRLISRCRKSPFVKRTLARDNLPFTLAIVSMLVAVSCQLGHRTDVTEAVGDGPAQPTHKEPSIATVASSSAPTTAAGATLVSRADRRPLATLQGEACDPKNPLKFALSLTSIFGSHALSATLTSDPIETVRAEVDGTLISFPAPANLAASLRASACAAPDARELPLESETTDRLRELVERIAPDCERIDLGPSGYECRLPVAEPEAARLELVGIQTSMIRRWSRQPYLLARRLAIGVTLAQTLQSTDPNKGLDTFCKLVTSSLPAELPAAIASKRWQQATCGADKAQRIDAALFGLAKTVNEIDVMRQLFERTSRLGHLQVKLPTTEVANRNVLISLTPDADVAENLTRETARLYAPEPPADASAEETPRACWHPLFSESPELFALARQLTIAGDGDQLSCQTSANVPASNPAFNPQKYFAESITSETEFIVTNGRAKTLRLPMGHYSYTIRVLPDDPATWDDASQVPPRGRGTIAWDAKRPRAVITEW